MFFIEKTFTFAAAHKLKLNYLSPCQNLHGHEWTVTVYCAREDVNENGMVIDFSEIKRLVHGAFDHKTLNDVFLGNPTAENLAKYIADSVPFCYMAKVEESVGSVAIYKNVAKLAKLNLI